MRHTSAFLLWLTALRLVVSAPIPSTDDALLSKSENPESIRPDVDSLRQYLGDRLEVFHASHPVNGVPANTHGYSDVGEAPETKREILLPRQDDRSGDDSQAGDSGEGDTSSEDVDGDGFSQ
ncbi:hypothetical protein ACMFMG_005068 [Clarireedia jacksonii]